MTPDRMSASGTTSRRSALGMLSVIPLAASQALAPPGRAEARSGSPSGPAPPWLRPGGAYDRFVRKLADEDQFSGTVLLAWHGKPSLIRSYQTANKAAGIPNRADTIFALASLTKFFTGLAVVQLAAAGKLNFYGTLGAYLNGFPPGVADTVTVHQLLTHTSGIADFMRSQAWWKAADSWTTRAEAFDGTLAVLRRLPLDFTPGTRYAYSNSNYFLAGAVTARASGQPYWDYLPRHVFTPAGMSSTGFYPGNQWLTDPRIAHNYGPRQTGGKRQDVTRELVMAGLPNGWDGAGGAFSSAVDLQRFALALQKGALLGGAWTEVAGNGKHPISPAQQNPDQAPSQTTLIGYGTEERIVGGQRAFGHTGALGVPVKGSSIPGGGSTSLSIYPNLGVVAVVLSNYFLYPGIGTFLREQDRIITRRRS